VTVGTTKKCRQRPLCRTNLLLRHFICRLDMFRDSSGRSDALDTSGLDIRVDFVHHG
jgi:hypothetical protein